ncbi:MAG: hypothetical protein IJK28_01855 [Clostridia bacterium]|nr:hypothetical protein [Clostridia bacterium]
MAVDQRGERLSVGDRVLFGHCGGREMRWQILDLDEGDALLIADRDVGALPYHSADETVAWRDCSLRRWLNTEFPDAAFSAEEMGMIRAIRPEEDTESLPDRVFPLSAEELAAFFDCEDDRALTCGEDFAGGACGSNGLRRTLRWWLRSDAVTGDDGRCYARVCDFDGDDGVYISVVSGRVAVRPSVHVRPEALRRADPEHPERPLLGYLKAFGDAAVTEFRGDRTVERRILASFADLEFGREYLILKNDAYPGPEVEIRSVWTEPHIGERAEEKMEALLSVLAGQPIRSAAALLQRELDEYRVANRLRQYAWVSETAEADPAIREGTQFLFGRFREPGRGKAADLRWTVLRRIGDRALLLLTEGLRYAAFAEEDDEPEEGTEVTWEESPIRAWLNGGFYETCFSEDEQCAILSCQTGIGDILGRTQPGDRPVFDRVFLLDDAEVNILVPEEARVIDDTPDEMTTASVAGLRQLSGPDCWWLRSAGRKAGCMMCVDTDGEIDYEGCDAVTEPCTVRPAVLIDLKELDYRQSMRGHYGN